MDITVTYRRDWGTGWIASEPAAMRRASHGLAHDGGVWLVDPVDGDGVDELIAPLGEVRGVIQLLDRHDRDCAALARRHGVPHLATPFDRVAGAPFQPVAVVRWSRWRETAMWWPEHRALVVAEALGTTEHFTLGHGPVGVHPLLRLTPPGVLRSYLPDHLLVGHGHSVHGSHTAAAVEHALEGSRSGAPKALVRLGALLVGQATRRATRSRAR